MTESGCRHFINADLMARGLAPLNVEAAAIEAGRLFLRQIRAQVQAGRDFAFETTLAGTAYMRQLRGRRPSMPYSQVGRRMKMKRLSKPSRDGVRAERALKRAVARVIEEHRRLAIRWR